MNEYEYPSRTTDGPPLHLLLRRRREELQLRQADIAEALSVSPECITLWEGGCRRMHLSKIPRLAEVLGMDAKELCTKSLAEFHPGFYRALFGPRDVPASMNPAA